jgi:hypothetical protein
MVDFTKTGDGFIVAFLTDANDPAQLNIPAGNWNYEIYASMSSNGGTPQLYAELYVYNGTTFTLISTSSNEILYDGTNLNLYSFAMTVPATTLALTDRLAIKLYATNSGGKTTTVHTQDSHLCQIITTFSTGITALNGLTAQVQYFQTGTSGTDFNISSTTATHTFNLPTASAANRGALSSADWLIFNGKQAQLNGSGLVRASGTTITYDSSNYITLTSISATAPLVYNSSGGVMAIDKADGFLSGYVSATDWNTFNNKQATITLTTTGTSGAATLIGATLNIPNYAPDLSNYVNLTTAQTIGGTKTFTDATKNNGGIFLQNGSSNSLAGYMNLGGLTNGLKFTSGGGISNTFTLPSSTGYTFTFPNATGTLALTSDISYPVTSVFGRTGAVVATEGDYSLTQLSDVTITSPSTGQVLKYNGTAWVNNSDSDTGITSLNGLTALTQTFAVGTSGTDFNISSATSTHTFNIPSASATNRGLVTTTTQTLAGVKTFSSNSKFDGAILLKNNVSSSLAGYVGLSALSFSGNKGINIDFDTYSIGFYFNGTLPYNYTFPNANGTVALTSDIPDVSGYVTLITAQTITGAKTFSAALNGTSAVFSSNFYVSGGTNTNVGNGIHAYYESNYAQLQLNGANTGGSLIDFSTSGTDYNGRIVFRNATNQFEFVTDSSTGSPCLTLLSTGVSIFSNNIGLGVTPSAWSVVTPVMQISTGGGFIGGQGSANVIRMGVNTYFSGTNWTYINSSFASWFETASGAFSWFNAPSGTAGGTFTPTKLMTLDASGQLGIGISPSAKLHSYNGSSGGTVSSNSNLLALETNGNNGMQFLNPSGNNANINFGDEFASEVGFIQYQHAVDAMRFRAGGTTIMSLVGGNAGFGTPSPLTTLTVKSTNDNGYALTRPSDATTYHWRLSTTETGADAYYTAYNTFNCEMLFSTYASGGTGGNIIWRTGSSGAGSLTERFRITPSGTATFTSSVTATSFFESSDSRLKTLIQDNYQTKGIASITPKLYTKNGKVELGYYAQDFVGILDSAVSKGSDDMLSLSYREVLVAKVYALEQEIKELKAKMN